MNSQSPIVDKMKQIRAMQAAMRGKVIYKDKENEFVGGGKWEIVTKFNGKSHEDGGIDLEVNDGYIRRISGTDDVDDIAKNGRVWRSVGAGAYGIGEGMLDALTLGATDALTDYGYSKLQKLGGSTEDEMREQDSVRGYGMAAGAIGSAVLTGGANIGSTIQQGAKGVGMGVSKGSPDSKFAQQVGVWLPVAGTIAGMAVGNAGYASGSDFAKIAKYGGTAANIFGRAKPFLDFADTMKDVKKLMKDDGETSAGASGAGGASMYNAMARTGYNMGGGMGNSLFGNAQRSAVYGGPSAGGGASSTEQDMFYAQVPMREDTLAQLTRYNINV